MRIYTCEQMREIERNANKGGMSYIKMMENAGEACAEKAYGIINRADKKNMSVCVLCGNGKNGGDGFVIARCLCKKGVRVGVVLVCGEPKAEEAADMYSLLKDLPVEISDLSCSAGESFGMIMSSDVIIDCIFGIGFKGEMRGAAAELVKDINSMNKTVISVDIPSGLEGDSGKVTGAHISANYTLAVSCKKPVHVLKPASDYCGKVFVINIGFGNKCYEIDGGCAFLSADNKFVKDALPQREADSNKGDFGRVLCICGSKTMQGAAVLCAEAAVKSGAGLVTCAFPESAYCAIAPKLTEPLMMPLDDDGGFFGAGAEKPILDFLKKCSAVVIGCGIGVNENTEKIVCSVIENAECPIIIDADGINALSKNINILKTAKAQVILTPHPGEMARLTGLSVSEIQKKRIETARAFSSLSGAVIVLKGCNTVVASPDSAVCINPTGNAGMATGGSGDMLAGMIASFCAQGMSAQSAAVCGAYLHGLCGDELAKKTSMRALTPSAMIDYLPRLFSKFENKG